MASRMAASKPGGRPRNAWNSSRRRKLVRLYTLTHLSTIEIGKVLKADDFNPCLRDIQARLKDLLPSDHARKAHQYRPKDESSSTTRLKRLQQHRQARKPGASLLRKDKHTSISTPGAHKQPWMDPYHVFEGPSSAFRNYAESGTSVDKPTQPSLYACSTESQLVNPSLLLLDGSSITGTTIIPGHQDQKQAQPLNDHTLPTASLGQSEALVRRLSRSSLVSLSSLQEKLSQRSSSMIRHVHSVLSFSSTKSWRSNVSWPPSWISFGSQSSASSIFSAPEVFTDLDELSYTKKVSLLRLRPHRESLKNYMAYGEFLCDHRPFQLPGSCADCGQQPIHQHIQKSKGLQIPEKILSKHIQKKDYFDNGVLHFAARFNCGTPDPFLRMIDLGADIHSINTCGATFVHLLFRFLKADEIVNFLPLLRRLSDLNFSFSSRDHWGRQPAHFLLKRRRDHFSLDSLDKLEEAFMVMKLDIDSRDVRGIWPRMHISSSFGLAKTEGPVSEFLSNLPISRNNTIKFAMVLSEMNGDWAAWMKWVSVEDRSAWVDSNGETALIALLKYWGHGQNQLLLPNIVKKMVDLGSLIEMRDRNGDTALAVAVKRGLCLAVKSLIELQASIHTTDKRGKGLLRSARKEMGLAKRNGHDDLYAMILICTTCLIDLEAWEFPSLRRELWAKWAPNPRSGWYRIDFENEERIREVLQEFGYL